MQVFRNWKEPSHPDKRLFDPFALALPPERPVIESANFGYRRIGRQAPRYPCGSRPAGPKGNSHHGIDSPRHPGSFCPRLIGIFDEGSHHAESAERLRI